MLEKERQPRPLSAFAFGGICTAVILVAMWAAIGRTAPKPVASQEPPSAAIQARMDELDGLAARLLADRVDVAVRLGQVERELAELKPAIQAAQFDKVPRRNVGPGSTAGSPQ